MNLKKVDLHKAYSSDFDNIVRDFYIPALKASFCYDRLAGFFSSTSLAIAARGIAGLVQNNGHIRLLVSPKLEYKDVEAILNSQEDPENYIAHRMLAELDSLEVGFVRDHVFALGWMIANGYLDIKTAIAYDGKKPLNYEEIQNRGLFHQKVGILRDSDGNTVTFSGSVNETAAGWMHNIEEFKVFRSWIPTESDYVEADASKFNRFWRGQSRRLKVIDIPLAVKKRLIDFAPSRVSDIRLKYDYQKSDEHDRVKLHQHQQDAIQAWLRNGKMGMFEMATGTGKTFTALGCLANVSETTTKLLTVIACPYSHLIQQWQRELNTFGIAYDSLVIADSTNPSWKNTLADLTVDVSLGYKDRVIVLTTHRTFSSKAFTDIIHNNRVGLNAFLIADEVHGLGAEKSKQGFIDVYSMRLGLSATPKRWFDSAGTEAIYVFFGGVVYEFDLKAAINTINPTTGRTYLTPYRYIPKFVSLTDEELEEYINKTKAIARMVSKAKDKEERDELLERLLFKRANIIKNAKAKYTALMDILDEVTPLHWTIVYCSPQQIDSVMEIMNQRRITAHRFTVSEGIKPEDQYDGLSEREFLLKAFADKRYQALVAMKCLDEGVDVPPARTSILMASSGNPREYIQRIGRIIRRYQGKYEATIYDIIVVPSWGNISSELASAEWAIFQKELERYEEIAEVAINNVEALKLIYTIKASVMEALNERRKSQ